MRDAYAVAGGAVAATWLIDHWDDVTAAPAPPRRPAMTTALDRFAVVDLPCRIRRLAAVTTLTGAQIRQLPSGAGEDFLREARIQTASLTAALGTLVPGFERPALTARCAREWIEKWLDVWQTANASDPRAFRVEQRATSAPDTSSTWRFLTSSLGEILTPWSTDPLPGHESYDRAGPWRQIASPARLSSLGRAWDRLRRLHQEAAAVAALAPIADAFGGLFGDRVAAAGEPVWVGARRTTEAILDFAGALDTVGFQHADIRAEAVAQLKRDLHPTRIAERAVDVAMTPIEGALEHVVGPALSATLGAVASTILPWLVVGGAVYLLARKVTS